MAIADSLDEPQRSELLQSVRDDLLDLVEGSVRLSRLEEKTNRRYPVVSPEEFVCSPKYLDKGGEIYPKVLDVLVEINTGDYDEVVLTGAIGVAKTTIALISTAYQLYLLGSYADPHRLLGQDRASELLFVFQSLDYSKSKDVDYSRFKTLIDESPFFREHFPYDPNIQSQMKFRNRIIVKPVTGTQTATIGQNVFGGVIDEVNYMRRIEKSKQAVDGGVYDQAIALYNSISRRRRSRFMRGGRLPGLLFLVSSKKYPGQFTDQKVAEAKKEAALSGRSRIYVYDRRTWEVLPADRFSGRWFSVFVGDEHRTPFVMSSEDQVAPEDRDLVMRVPEEYRDDFEKDIIEALREIGGVSTLAHHPFLVQREKVAAAFTDRRSIFNRTEIDLKNESLVVYPGRFDSPREPRWVHIDPSLTGDSTGLSIGYVKRFVEVRRGDHVEYLPEIHADATLRIRPPRGGEIEFWRIRKHLYRLQRLGLNIQWVTLDSFQSRDFIQQAVYKGFSSFVLSLDSKPDGYVYLKNAVYDGRLSVPQHPHLLRELLALEFDVEKQRVDHPPNGSKDVADSLAGVVWGLSTRGELRARHGAPMLESSTASAQAGSTGGGEDGYEVVEVVD